MREKSFGRRRGARTESEGRWYGSLEGGRGGETGDFVCGRVCRYYRAGWHRVARILPLTFCKGAWGVVGSAAERGKTGGGGGGGFGGGGGGGGGGLVFVGRWERGD